MTPIDQASDPRRRLEAALDQLEREIDLITPGDHVRPTPCAEYDVRTLLAHLVAVLRKLTVVGHGGDMASVPDPAVDLAGGERAAVRLARARFDEAWLSTDAVLDAAYDLAWASMTGRELLDAYTHEFTVHAWDLSQATGHRRALDPTLAEAALDWFSSNLTAEDRGDDGPFAEPLTAADDADPYTALAAYLGRSPQSST